MTPAPMPTPNRQHLPQPQRRSWSAALGWLCLGLLLAGLPGCGPQLASPQLGIHFAAQLRQSDVQAIRSFRILAFQEGKVYRCSPTTHTVTYGTAGYTASATLDWQQISGTSPELQLFLPKDATTKGWIIQVEAFTVASASQLGEQPIATGCVGNVRMFDERPVNADVQLHSVR